MVEEIVVLRPCETVRLDIERLEELVLETGVASAEDIVCRALEELAARLAQMQSLWRCSALSELRKSARGLGAIAEQVGMQLLARVARDVMHCIDERDETALAATLSRLLRIGELSLSEVWQMQDLTI